MKNTLLTLSFFLIGSMAASDPSCQHVDAISTYTIKSNDTIFSIADTYNTTVCDISRYNHVADPQMLYAGEELYIPPQRCAHSDPSHSCLLTNQNATNTCVNGGPHTYTTFEGDTIRKIALAKFNITIEALNSTAGHMTYGSSADIDDEIESGISIKVPQCHPSRCEFEPFYYTWGTYKDLAIKYNTTPGHIFALNPTFNHSETGPGVGGWITLPMNCGPLSDNVTVVS
ncbi:uncharacterized protein ASPGLDRAFT_124396 [Aspergillus glaucus CBS 516.65]|uniref:LysM domain-containing protein n=1 Tax=Aspergillus glaucus CBS 516.65 TaxID=1160497 RepID=A0A1L9VN06_ASPGL|nr:hypothetical protein ASPGLDRAFT_124396 [Aspergillus glaucus CBS 516.65]OJJ85281.1 hypothetical protein ASPGLDRAFT_124396 [Aspergillus glaucus CBS 516.65]